MGARGSELLAEVMMAVEFGGPSDHDASGEPDSIGDILSEHATRQNAKNC